ncbi:YIP1 family protein [bacterium]|nr:YIP1 family protein [bacterium]
MNEHHKHDHDMQDEFKKHLDGAGETFKEIGHPGKFDLKKEFMNSIEILKLNEKKIHDISIRKTTASAAFLFIAAGVVSMSLGTYFMFPAGWRMSVGYLLVSMIVSLITAFVAIFAIDFVGSQFFKGKGSFGELFRVMGYAYVLMIPFILIAVAPGLYSLLGLVLGVWMIVVTYKIISVIKKLNPTNTILTIIIVGIVLAIIFGILQYFGIGAGYAQSPEINNLNDALKALSKF